MATALSLRHLITPLSNQDLWRNSIACRVLFQRLRIFTNRLSRSMSFFSDAGSCQTTAKAFAERRGGIPTADHRFFHVEQLFVMRDIAVAFDGERKSLRRLVAP